MKKYNFHEATMAIKGYKHLPITEIAKDINRNPKAVYEWLRKTGYKKRPRYSEMECFLLLNYNINACKQVIPYKSLNALRIKQWRLRKAIRANASTS